MPAAMTNALWNQDTRPSNGARLVSTDGRTLPLTGVSVRARAAGGLCRVTLEQRFVNPHDEPLRLTYQVPLPEDGAVSAYRFRLGYRTIEGRVETRTAAREQFEIAIIEGRSAALLEEERGSLFTQELGNVPGKAEIVCTLTIDQKLVWLDEGAWEWRFPTVVAPRYLGQPGTTPDAERIVVTVADGPIQAKAALALTIDDARIGGPTSPSHIIHTELEDGHQLVTTVAALDRDLVVRWAARQTEVGVSLQRTGTHALVTLTPPARPMTSIGRDVCILFDTSGSMDGAPLAQARRVAAAIVDSLGAGDQLEMIEFSNAVRRWKKGSVAVDAKQRVEAHAWLAKLSASGSTDMVQGIMEALGSLRRDTQRQVVLITDGQIGFERDVLQQIRRLIPKASRLHTIGVGSGVNRSLTGPAARAGSGIEVVIGLDESAEPAARRIVKRTAQPLVTEVCITGSALFEQAIARPLDLFSGSPALLSLKLRPEGGTLVVHGRAGDGPFEQTLEVPPAEEDTRSPLAALFARERVAELELDHAAGDDATSIDAEIERLGLAYQIATRLTSFIAVSDEVTVDPTAPSHRERQPHMLPHGVSATGLGLRMPMPAMPVMMASVQYDVSSFSPQASSASGAMPTEGFGSGGAPKAAKERERRSAPPSEAAAPPRSPARVPAPAPAPAPEPVPAKPRMSVLSRVKKFLSRSSVVRTAKVVLRKDRKRVVELSFDRDVTWPAAPALVLRDTSGELVVFTLSSATHAGAIAAEQIVRITLELDAGIELATIDVELDGTSYTFELEA